VVLNKIFYFERRLVELGAFYVQAGWKYMNFGAGY
jgi:hypothetical protein